MTTKPLHEQQHEAVVALLGYLLESYTTTPQCLELLDQVNKLAPQVYRALEAAGS